MMELVRECGGDGHGGDDWEDPALERRETSLEFAVDVLKAHAPDAGKLSPEEIAKGAVTVARSFENYLSGGEFMPTEPDQMSGPLF